MTPADHITRAAEVIEHALSRHGGHGTYLDAARALDAAGLLASDHLTAELATARTAWDEWKASSRAGHAHASDMAAENARLRAGIEALHRPVHPVFSWNSGLRFDEPCPECNGKAGVHPCGCWSDEDTEYECLECIKPKDGLQRRHVPWPCGTADLLNPPTEGETDHE